MSCARLTQQRRQVASLAIIIVLTIAIAIGVVEIILVVIVATIKAISSEQVLALAPEI